LGLLLEKGKSQLPVVTLWEWDENLISKGFFFLFRVGKRPFLSYGLIFFFWVFLLH
jgi:hypothetical protein